MAKKKRNLDAKSFAQNKLKRRQWLTFMRMCRYGVNNFSRNAWLTVAATAVMTITLLVVFMTLSARNVLIDTVAQISDKVDMSIYVKHDIDDEDVETLKGNLNSLESVERVSYVSPDEARENFAKANSANADTLEALNEATNRFPGTFRIKVTDINDTSELREFTESSQVYQANKDSEREPSFAGERRTAIENIGRWVGFAERLGLVASVIFIGVSSLIIFNTIRMAIFNRKDEIQMMKLIGADRNFIRGPFIVEAIVYGFIAALVATGLGIAILYASSEGLMSYGVMVEGTLDMATRYIGLVILGMIILGAVIGIASSLLATRRYLKI